MKTALIALLLAASAAHAANTSANHGHHGATLGSTAHTAAPANAAPGTSTQGSNGRASLVDDYQPWPQAEMQQFAKPKFVPFDGK